MAISSKNSLPATLLIGTRMSGGEALNFDGEDSGPVREFFASNAAYWIDEYHLDGLRFDATQQIFDASPNHILAVMTRLAREAAGQAVHLSCGREPSCKPAGWSGLTRAVAMTLMRFGMTTFITLRARH